MRPVSLCGERQLVDGSPDDQDGGLIVPEGPTPAVRFFDSERATGSDPVVRALTLCTESK